LFNLCKSVKLHFTKAWVSLPAVSLFPVVANQLYGLDTGRTYLAKPGNLNIYTFLQPGYSIRIKTEYIFLARQRRQKKGA